MPMKRAQEAVQDEFVANNQHLIEISSFEQLEVNITIAYASFKKKYHLLNT